MEQDDHDHHGGGMDQRLGEKELLDEEGGGSSASEGNDHTGSNISSAEDARRQACEDFLLSVSDGGSWKFTFEHGSDKHVWQHHVESEEGLKVEADPRLQMVENEEEGGGEDIANWIEERRMECEAHLLGLSQRGGHCFSFKNKSQTHWYRMVKKNPLSAGRMRRSPAALEDLLMTIGGDDIELGMQMLMKGMLSLNKDAAKLAAEASGIAGSFECLDVTASAALMVAAHLSQKQYGETAAHLKHQLGRQVLAPLQKVVDVGTERYFGPPLRRPH
jgi:hypothetical protein